MAWTIFYAPGNPRRIGCVGPSTTKKTAEEIRNHPKRKLFAMYEDGEELPDFIGFNVGSDPFAPLDDLGTPDTGCTRIEYLNEETCKWETI